MPKLEYTPQVSLGNMLTILAMVIGMAVAWGANEIRIAGVEAAVAAFGTRFNAIEERIRVNENALSRQDERWAAVINTLARIERKLETLEAKQ